MCLRLYLFRSVILYSKIMEIEVMRRRSLRALTVCVCVCDMGGSGLTYLMLLRLVVFPMCKTVTESLIKVGRKCSSTLNDTFTLT